MNVKGAISPKIERKKTRARAEHKRNKKGRIILYAYHVEDHAVFSRVDNQK